ncbi:MAG TPA: response regulator [Minicystis sp.]|nr:response regulator [Minicystis sp.]
MKPAEVLIVDDEADIRETLRAILEDEGYRVATAENGKVALEALLRGARPKLILLDLTMPVMNGWETLERLRRDHDLATIPVAVVSAVCDATGPLPTTHCLHKPFDIEQLLALLDAEVHASAA